jgi:acyl-CoA thioesterase-1
MAEPTLIVALGASNTAGFGVETNEAYPAVIERLLRERGIDATVVNAGISGDPTSGMLARLDRDIPPDTRLVLFQPGSNDLRLGLGEAVRERNIQAIQTTLAQRGIAVLRVAAAFKAARSGNLQDDGIHYTALGHEAIATQLIEEVMAGLRVRG